jgi:hypothetical protein
MRLIERSAGTGSAFGTAFRRRRPARRFRIRERGTQPAPCAMEANPGGGGPAAEHSRGLGHRQPLPADQSEDLLIRLGQRSEGGMQIECAGDLVRTVLIGEPAKRYRVHARWHEIFGWDTSAPEPATTARCTHRLSPALFGYRTAILARRSK